MRVFFLGDVVADAGLKAVRALLPDLRRELGLSFVIANGENVAHGNGITRETMDELFGAGVDAITGGNHIWDKPQGIAAISEEARVVRPANYPEGTPGRGCAVFEPEGGAIAVVNVLGRTYMPPIDCPFRAVDHALETMGVGVRMIIVDVHAEASAEKIALGVYLDGRVSAVVGTHTHVQTADEKILPQGTAYLTDAGMTGPHDSIIGVRKDLALKRWMSGLPVRFHPAEGDPRLEGVWFDIDATTGRATHIERVQRSL